MHSQVLNTRAYGKGENVIKIQRSNNSQVQTQVWTIQGNIQKEIRNNASEGIELMC